MKLSLLFVSAFLALSFLGLSCSKTSPDLPFDSVSGTVSADYHPQAEQLAPREVKLNSEFENYTIIEHLVFIGQQDSVRRALTATFRRSIGDNNFIRAQRDFSGFLFDGQYWRAMPYTKAKHDTTRLDHDYSYPFGGVEWNSAHDGGRFHYDRREIKADLEFSNLALVQVNSHGEFDRRMHAIGTGTLSTPTGAITGSLIYELVEVNGYNPFDSIDVGVEYTNYDWIVLLDSLGNVLVASSDSTTANDRILKNFVVFKENQLVMLAEGSQYVRISSDVLQRDPKIYDTVALKKLLAVPDLQLRFELLLMDPRVFYTNGYLISLLDGTLELAGQNRSVWGIIEHWQHPKSGAEELR